MYNSEDSKMFANVEGETRDGEKVSPDAVVFESGASDYYRTQEQVQASKERSAANKAEREKELKQFFKRLGLKVAIIAGVVLTTSAAAVNVEKERAKTAQEEFESRAKDGERDSQSLLRKQYEEKIDDFLNNKENPNIHYGDDGSVTVTYEQAWRDGTMDKYRLEDTDGDALYESGTMMEENGPRSAAFKSDEGLDIASAHAELRANFAQNSVN